MSKDDEDLLQFIGCLILGKLLYDAFKKYRCPRCNYPVDRSNTRCPNCGQPLYWRDE